jgi:hypothetical protein
VAVTYPNYNFKVDKPGSGKFDKLFTMIEMLTVPNKKVSGFFIQLCHFEPRNEPKELPLLPCNPQRILV